jgi:transcriptional regulator with XRE-family HTH domain
VSLATATRLPAGEPTPVGTLLRGWRERRRLSQLDLALRAGVSARHLSFVETGRSRPTSEMIIRLAEQLEVPLRERNVLLLSGGYAPAYPTNGLADPPMAAVHEAIERVLRAHEPFPAVVIDAIVNLAEWRAHLLHRLNHDIESAGDPGAHRAPRRTGCLPEPAGRRPPGHQGDPGSLAGTRPRHCAVAIQHHDDFRHAPRRDPGRISHRVVLPGRLANSRVLEWCAVLARRSLIAALSPSGKRVNSATIRPARHPPDVPISPRGTHLRLRTADPAGPAVKLGAGVEIKESGG